MPFPRRFAFVSVLFAALAVAPAAHARVVLVATADGNAALTDVTTNKVVARVPVGGRASGVAIAPDGTRGYVATGRHVAAIDLGTRRIVARERARRDDGRSSRRATGSACTCPSAGRSTSSTRRR